MSDLLVRLYSLPVLAPAIEAVQQEGFEIRRALSPENPVLLPWVSNHFSEGWAAECQAAMMRQPPSCFIATRGQDLCGFAAYEATSRNFFGPIGVLPAFRTKHIGRALLLAALHAMHGEGYAYAVIGSAGPAEFFRKTVGATVIEDSSPGIYRGMLR